MSKHAGYHAGNTSDGLEEDEADKLWFTCVSIDQVMGVGGKGEGRGLFSECDLRLMHTHWASVRGF